MKKNEKKKRNPFLKGVVGMSGAVFLKKKKKIFLEIFIRVSF